LKSPEFGGRSLVKKLIVFDLDGTLAESKSSLDPEMSGLLHDLLGVVKVAVISGGDWPQFEKQVVSKLPHDERLTELSLLSHRSAVAVEVVSSRGRKLLSAPRQCHVMPFVAYLPIRR
jgi:trehalose-6-phosphatase